LKNNNFRPPESILENTEQTVVLVDYSNLLYRAWFVSSKRPWVAFCKFFDMLRLCVKRSKQKGVPIKVIFAGESKTKLKRCDIFPEYKGTRIHAEDPKFYKFRTDLQEMLQTLGWDIISVLGAEADDIIASIVADNCDHDLNCKTDIVIFSGDRDLQQCLAWSRVLIYRAPGLFVDKDTFEDEYGIPIAKYGVYKALVGDRSDNIKGVTGFGPSKAQTAICANSVAEDIWEFGGKKAADDFKLSLSLVNLDTKLDIDITLNNLYFGPPKINEEEFKKKYDKRVLLEVQRLKEEF